MVAIEKTNKEYKKSLFNKGYVYFYEDTHRYERVMKNKNKTSAPRVFYESCTTFWNKYTPGFTATKENTKSTEIKLGLTHEQVIEYWKDNSKNALKRGSQIHKMKEDFICSRKEWDVFNKTFKVNPKSFKEKYAVWSELIVWSDRYKLAGQIDRLMKIDNRLIIRDYKTNKKKIVKESYKDKRLKPPFSDIPASDYYKYGLQLQTYALMLLELYPELEIDTLEIEHIPVDDYSISEFNPLIDTATTKQNIITLNPNVNYVKSKLDLIYGL